MLKLLDNFLVADINIENVIERYANLDAFSQGRLASIKSNFSARNMGKMIYGLRQQRQLIILS
jgi:hypothetical protein